MTPPLFRTLSSIRNAWRDFTSAGHNVRAVSLDPALPDQDLDKLRQLMQDCLQARGGEVSARARAAILGQAYIGLNDDGRIRYLRLLADEFNVSGETLAAARDLIDKAPGDPGQVSRLRELLTPPRVKLLTQFNDLPQGVKFLVDMRADVLIYQNTVKELRGLEYDLKRLLKSWFDIGFLELKRLTWRDPAILLEKLIEYEAVHEISSWDDLRNRLDSDRRCYAFFHPCMPDEPLIFVEVALVMGISRNIQDLLDEQAPTIDPLEADTAIFYSITNTQKGLQGIQFGSFLIKQVLDDLRRDLPQLETFATLSPVPGFMHYLSSLSAGTEQQLLNRQESAELEKTFANSSLREVMNSANWQDKIEGDANLKRVLLRVCAHYLVHEKKGNRALDPVANFHLNNGARLENLNWMADRSEHGLRQSAGMMVNYIYRLNDIERNHENYRQAGDVAASSAVRGMTNN